MSMSKTNDGGPAFPRPASEDRTQGDQPDGNRTIDPQGGMSLRDWFAGRVLGGLFAAADVRLSFQEGHEQEPDRIAALAYRFADAMLREREGKPS